VDIESNPKATKAVLVEDCKFIAVVARGDFSMLNISLKDFSQFIFGIVINVSMSQSVALKKYIYLCLHINLFSFFLGNVTDFILYAGFLQELRLLSGMAITNP